MTTVAVPELDVEESSALSGEDNELDAIPSSFFDAINAASHMDFGLPSEQGPPTSSDHGMFVDKPAGTHHGMLNHASHSHPGPPSTAASGRTFSTSNGGSVTTGATSFAGTWAPGGAGPAGVPHPGSGVPPGTNSHHVGPAHQDPAQHHRGPQGGPPPPADNYYYQQVEHPTAHPHGNLDPHHPDNYGHEQNSFHNMQNSGYHVMSADVSAIHDTSRDHLEMFDNQDNFQDFSILSGPEHAPPMKGGAPPPYYGPPHHGSTYKGGVIRQGKYGKYKKAGSLINPGKGGNSAVPYQQYPGGGKQSMNKKGAFQYEEEYGGAAPPGGHYKGGMKGAFPPKGSYKDKNSGVYKGAGGGHYYHQDWSYSKDSGKGDLMQDQQNFDHYGSSKHGKKGAAVHQHQYYKGADIYTGADQPRYGKQAYLDPYDPQINYGSAAYARSPDDESQLEGGSENVPEWDSSGHIRDDHSPDYTARGSSSLRPPAPPTPSERTAGGKMGKDSKMESLLGDLLRTYSGTKTNAKLTLENFGHFQQMQSQNGQQSKNWWTGIKSARVRAAYRDQTSGAKGRGKWGKDGKPTANPRQPSLAGKQLNSGLLCFCVTTAPALPKGGSTSAGALGPTKSTDETITAAAGSATSTTAPPPERDPRMSTQLTTTDEPDTTVYILTRDEISIMSDALQSLYDDRIFPGEKVLKARLQQYGAREMLLGQFLTFYDAMPGYIVQWEKDETEEDDSAEKPDYYNVDECPNVQFTRVSLGFRGWIDPNSPEESYPDELWPALTEYLEKRLKEMPGDICFHRGRYGMAQELQNRTLDFLQGYTIGETCHIVERAIQRKVLAYENSMLLPVSACCSFKNALVGAPNAISYPGPLLGGGDHAGAEGGGDVSNADGTLAGAAGAAHCENPDMYVQTMAELQRYISVLLEASPTGFNLSVVKIKIRSVFQKILSETVFHETKLLDLMRRPDLQKVCRIVKLNKGYWIERVPLAEQAAHDAEREQGSCTRLSAEEPTSTTQSAGAGGGAASCADKAEEESEDISEPTSSQELYNNFLQMEQIPMEHTETAREEEEFLEAEEFHE
ncbi:unnamed protein product [Amoebophrya sp. A120]|nr:unnamed protein product [Amoebophrya sp. A120]|eukprot:GSA120T00018901001.1